jgi:hypothetical protein
MKGVQFVVLEMFVLVERSPEVELVAHLCSYSFVAPLAPKCCAQYSALRQVSLEVEHRVKLDGMTDFGSVSSPPSSIVFWFGL